MTLARRDLPMPKSGTWQDAILTADDVMRRVAEMIPLIMIEGHFSRARNCLAIFDRSSAPKSRSRPGTREVITRRRRRAYLPDAVATSLTC